MQAGSKSGYSTSGHIRVVNQLKEKCREYNITLCITFVNYEKAFDLVQTQAVLTSLQEHEVVYVYIEPLKEIYTNSSVTVHIHKDSKNINIMRGVRHGGGLKIDGEYLSHLRFTDDILICVNTSQMYRN